MKNRVFTFILAFLITGIIIFFGCKKNQTFDKHLISEVNVQLVSLDTARNIAVKFNPSIFFNTNNSSNHSPSKSLLTGNNDIKDYTIVKDSKGFPAIYIFNFADNNGVLFISAEYKLRPILAYIEHGNFKKDTVPPGLIQWANKTINDIEIVRKGLYDNSKIAKKAWQNYFNDSNKKQLSSTITPNKVPPPPPTDPCQLDPNYSASTTQTVGPLLPVTWGQYCSYNNLCPNVNCNDCSPNAVTGCVATSMSQIIRYWQPSNNHNYNYSSMPTTYGNGEVQRLMHDAGITVNMGYGCAATGGSAADGGNVPGALKSNFGFSSADRSSYNTSSYSTVQNNISNNWPVLLEGCNDQTNRFLGIWYAYQDCHEWVCDGYQQTDVTFCSSGSSVSESYLSFHMNWGWHELYSSNDYNGWFAFNNWNISGAGQNGSDLNFRYANNMVTNIHP